MLVDPTVAFKCSADETITMTGEDYISDLVWIDDRPLFARVPALGRPSALLPQRGRDLVAAVRRGRRRRLRATNSPINGTAALLGFSDEASLDVAPGAPYTFTIEPLRQSSAVYAGYCVRISALNSAGFGVPTTRSCSRSPTEGGVPDAPVLVELMRVAGSWTTLRVFWAFVQARRASTSASGSASAARTTSTRSRRSTRPPASSRSRPSSSTARPRRSLDATSALRFRASCRASELTLATKFFYGTAATRIARDLGVTVPGKLPRQYASVMVDVADEFCTIVSLTPGAEFFVRVCTTRTRSAARTRPSA